jgi:uncharacterized protein (UPF0332 family)
MTVGAEIHARMSKAHRKLEAAELLYSRNFTRARVSSAYFAMFHAATAMGLAAGRRFPPCSGWLAVFGETFVETAKVHRGLYADLLEAYGLRRIADYEPLETIPAELAESTLRRAREFVVMAEQFLREENP